MILRQAQDHEQSRMVVDCARPPRLSEQARDGGQGLLILASGLQVRSYNNRLVSNIQDSITPLLQSLVGFIPSAFKKLPP